MKVKKVPMRMCIACHAMKPKKEMLRVVKPKEGDVFIDFTGKAAGRGAYICDDPGMYQKAAQRAPAQPRVRGGDPAGRLRADRGGLLCKEVKRKDISASVSKPAN